MGTSERLELIIQLTTRLQEAQHTLIMRQDPVDQYFLNKINEWTTKIFAIAEGYNSEFDLMYTHRVVKNRSLFKGHADVTIGEFHEFFAKSVQSKATTGNHNVVNKMLGEAFNQLTGERGEHPRPNDRLAIKMVIDNVSEDGSNTWPASTKGVNWTQEHYANVANQQLKTLATKYQKHLPKQPGKGLNKATIDSLTDVQGWPVVSGSYIGSKLVGPKSSQQIMLNDKFQYEKIIHLTIKISYERGFPIVNTQGGYSFLRRATFNGIKNGEGITFNLFKAEFYESSPHHKAANLSGSKRKRPNFPDE